MMVGLDAIHTNNRFLRASYPAKVPRVSLPIVEPGQTCLNHGHIMLFLHTCEWFHLQSESLMDLSNQVKSCHGSS